MFSEADLRDLGNYLKKFVGECQIRAKEEGKSPPDEEEVLKVLDVRKQLQAIRHNPLLFKSLCEHYNLPAKCLEVDLYHLPLHINDQGLVSEAIVRWRLDKGV